MRDVIFISLLVGALGCGDAAATSDAGMDGPSDAATADGSTDVLMDLGPARDRPKLSVRRIDFEGDVVFTQPGEMVELVGVASGQLFRIALDGTLSDALHTFDVAPTMDPPPVAVFDADGALHVFWEADRAVHHASDQSGAWVEEEIARGYAPSAVLAPDGRLLLAYAAPGGISSEPTATLATLDGDGWAMQSVADIGKFTNWVGLAVGPEDHVLLAGALDDGSVWIQQEDAPGSFADIGLDIRDHLFLNASADWALGAGPAGIALHFRSNGNYVAYRPTEASSFTISQVGPTYSVADYERATLLAPAAGATLSLVDYDRILVLSPGSDFWPVLAGVPWPDCQDGNTSRNVSTSVDGEGHLLLAAKGCSGVELFYEDGALAEDWESECTALVAATCDEACTCGGESQCSFLTAYSSTGYSDRGGNRSGCELDARAALCWNATRSVDAMSGCLATFETPEACVAPGYPLSDACQALTKVEP